MPLPSQPSIVRPLRQVGVCAALLAATSLAHAGLIGSLLDPLLTVTFSLLNSGSTYAAERELVNTAANAPLCRAEDRHRGIERRSYGTGSPRQRQLLNDCANPAD